MKFAGRLVLAALLGSATALVSSMRALDALALAAGRLVLGAALAALVVLLVAAVVFYALCALSGAGEDGSAEPETDSLSVPSGSPLK